MMNKEDKHLIAFTSPKDAKEINQVAVEHGLEGFSVTDYSPVRAVVYIPRGVYYFVSPTIATQAILAGFYRLVTVGTMIESIIADSPKKPPERTYAIDGLGGREVSDSTVTSALREYFSKDR